MSLSTTFPPLALLCRPPPAICLPLPPSHSENHLDEFQCVPIIHTWRDLSELQARSLDPGLVLQIFLVQLKAIPLFHPILLILLLDVDPEPLLSLERDLCHLGVQPLLQLGSMCHIEQSN